MRQSLVFTIPLNLIDGLESGEGIFSQRRIIDYSFLELPSGMRQAAYLGYILLFGHYFFIHLPAIGLDDPPEGPQYAFRTFLPTAMLIIEEDQPPDGAMITPQIPIMDMTVLLVFFTAKHFKTCFIYMDIIGDKDLLFQCFIEHLHQVDGFACPIQNGIVGQIHAAPFEPFTCRKMGK